MSEIIGKKHCGTGNDVILPKRSTPSNRRNILRKMDNEFTEYVLVLETHNAGDQVIIKSIFDAEGVIYFIQGEYVAPYLFNALPMRVMVKKDQEEIAREILKDIKLSYSYNLRKSREDTNSNEEK